MSEVLTFVVGLVVGVGAWIVKGLVAPDFLNVRRQQRATQAQIAAEARAQERALAQCKHETLHRHPVMRKPEWPPSFDLAGRLSIVPYAPSTMPRLRHALPAARLSAR